MSVRLTVYFLLPFRMKKSTLGLIGGASALAVGAPLLLPLMAYAATASSASSAKTARPAPTQACVQAMAAQDADFLAHIDAMIAAQKAATQAHKDALTAAAALTDDAQRQAAVQKANQAFRTAMDAVRKDDKTAADAVRAACGAAGKGGMMEGMHGPNGKMRGPGMDNLAQKLGLTDAQLKEELKAGKTLQQIAQEKGVTLPAPTAKGGMMRWGHQKNASSSSVSAQ
jgi:hypothetical protein